MKLRTIDNFDFKGKKVLVRADLNSPVKNGRVLMNNRLVESAKTINELKKKGACVVVLAYQSRPGKKDFISLKQHARLMKIKFVEDTIGKKAVGAIEKLKNGGVLLLENVRFLKEEYKPSANNKIVKNLAPLFDYYVNDAFSVSHRNQTSMVSFPKVLKSCVGRLMERELKHLEKLKVGNCLFVLGGAKMEEVVGMVDGKRKILAGGLLGPVILYANGQKFGRMDKILKEEKKHFRKLKNPKKVIPAFDYGFEVDKKRKEWMLDELPSKYKALDIGSKSIEVFVSEIRKAKAVFVKGPMGMYEDKRFMKGTKEILKAVSKCKFSVLGGGHTENAVRVAGINKNKFDYVSLSGGATVQYLKSEKLPGIEALKRGKKL